MGVFDNIPAWALALAEPAKPPEDQTAEKAAAELAKLQAEALAAFNAPEPVKRKPGRPKGSKNATPRATVAQPGADPDPSP